MGRYNNAAIGLYNSMESMQEIYTTLGLVFPDSISGVAASSTRLETMRCYGPAVAQCPSRMTRLMGPRHGGRDSGEYQSYPLFAGSAKDVAFKMDRVATIFAKKRSDKASAPALFGEQASYQDQFTDTLLITRGSNHTDGPLGLNQGSGGNVVNFNGTAKWFPMRYAKGSLNDQDAPETYSPYHGGTNTSHPVNAMFPKCTAGTTAEEGKFENYDADSGDNYNVGSRRVNFKSWFK